MRRGYTIFMVGLLLAGCASDAGEEGNVENAASEEVAAASADEAALEELRASYAQHYNLHHASVVADMYDDSAVALLADGGIHEGKAEILASLEGAMAATPTLDLSTIETRVFGDNAVSLGRYTVQATPPGGEAVSSSGSYMSVSNRTDAGWKLLAVITNFDAPPPEGFPYVNETSEEPPEEGTMKALTDAWAQHFNLGHASVVAGYYEDGAKAAFSDGPMHDGKAAIEAALTQMVATGSPQITIHDVYTMDLGDGYALDAGWWESTATVEGQTTRRDGTYFVLNHLQPDGTYKIVWQVSNGGPAT